MAHVSEGTLRRLVDEPLAVPDAAAEHVASCRRCANRRGAVMGDALYARTHLSPLLPAPDVDAAWRRLQATAPGRPASAAGSRRAAAPAWTRRSWRFLAPARPSPAVLLFLAVLLAGAAAGTALTLVLGAPAPAPAPDALPAADFQAMADVTGVAHPGGVLGGLSSASGSLALPFGVLRWSSAGPARRVASAGAAEAVTGLNVRVPHLPAGVAPPAIVVVQPAVTATLTFGPRAPASLRGTALTVTAGPAVLVEYGSPSGGLGIPAVASFAMRRPTLAASRAPGGAAALEGLAYVLTQPGLPPGLVQEIRLVAGVATILPVATSGGPDLSQVDVGGAPGILVTDGSGVASGVIWQDRAGVVRAVLGLLDRKDVLDVADQLG